MIISRTPLRISFFGGGTDYPVWYEEQPGTVLATSINKYTYITCRYFPPFFDHHSRIVWSRIEMVKRGEEIVHPSVRETLKYLGLEEGVEIHHIGDLPARTGLGSSSSFTVGLLHALYALKGVMPPKIKLAQEAIHIEQNLIRENVGSQDQVTAAYGGFNQIHFSAGNNIQVTPMICGRERLAELQNHLMLVFTGFARNASEVAEEQVRLTSQRKTILARMGEMVEEAIKIVTGRSDLNVFGRLLHESWLLKKELTGKISTPKINEIYEIARSAGAPGGKLLGAGGGGFMLLYAKPDRQPAIREALNGLLHVPFSFDNSGSQIIFYDPNDVHASFIQPNP